MRGFPLDALNIEDLFKKLKEWQDMNLIPMGFRKYKEGHLYKETVSYAI
jgi:hypothetical protein